jgi:hypothetical protein
VHQRPSCAACAHAVNQPHVCGRNASYTSPADSKTRIHDSRTNRLEKSTRYLSRSDLALPTNDTPDPGTDVAPSPATTTHNRSLQRDVSRIPARTPSMTYRTRADPLLIPLCATFYPTTPKLDSVGDLGVWLTAVTLGASLAGT